MLRALYSLALHAATPLLLRKLRRRGRAEPGYLEALGERFGRYDRPAAPGALWIHAVSLGETRAAAVLLAALREREPGLRVLLTHGTATGRAEGARLLRPGDAQAWLPWDTPGAVRRFLAHFRPRAGVLMETEVWPNLVAHCARQRVPLALANARLSPRSFRGARRLPGLARPAYGALAAVWAQTQDDADRLAAVGARVAGVFGNLKFDARPDPAQRAQGRAWRAGAARPVLMLASSREGEEAALLAALSEEKVPARLMNTARSAIESEAPRVRWLVVPRHPQRFDAVEQLARATGRDVSRRSGWVQGLPALPAGAAPELLLGDSLGEMALYYALADVALLGGSFEPLGGQNLIEAAACGCPLVMGPHTFNFAEAAEGAIAAGAALRVADMAQAQAVATTLALDGPRRAAMSQAALAFAAAHQGAAERTAQAVFDLLDHPPHHPTEPP